MSVASLKRHIDNVENLESCEPVKRQKVSISNERQEKEQTPNPVPDDDVEEIIDVREMEEPEGTIDDQEDDYGLQSEESNGPLHLDIEAREAEIVAKNLGLNTPEEAVSRVGKSTHLTQRLDTYTQIIEKDPVTKNAYEELTKEVEKVEKPLQAGLAALVAFVTNQDSPEKQIASPNVINFARTVMDKFVKMVIEAALTHAEYRESSTITLTDVLESLKILGRPVYWNSEITEPDVKPEQVDDANGDESEESDSEEDEEESETEQGKPVNVSGSATNSETPTKSTTQPSNNNNNINTSNADTIDEEEEQTDSKLLIDSDAFKTLVTTIVEASLADDEEDDEENDDNGDMNETKDEAECKTKTETAKEEPQSAVTHTTTPTKNEENSTQAETTKENSKTQENANQETNEETSCGYTIEPAALEAIQQSTESYLLAVLQGASNLARYVGRQTIEQEDMRFVLNMWKAIPGGNEAIRRMRW